MKHIIITILTLLSISLQAQIRMNTKQSFVDSTRLVSDSILVYYQNGNEIRRDTIVGTGGGAGSELSVYQEEFVANGIDSTYTVTKSTLPTNVSNIIVSQNGLVVDEQYISKVNNNTIRLSYLPDSADNIVVIWFLGGGGSGGLSSVLVDSVTIYGDGLTTPLYADTAKLATTTALNDSITNSLSGYVTIAGTETITGAKTFTANTVFDDSTLVVDATNNRVGIGTTSPSGNVEINAPISSISASQFLIKDATNSGFFRISDGTSSTGAYLPAFYGISNGLDDYGIQFYGGPISTRDIGTAGRAAITFEAVEYDTATNTYSALENSHLFQFSNFGSVKMFIQNNGNVGIGTTSPSDKLTVSGSASSTTGINLNAINTNSTGITRFKVTNDAGKFGMMAIGGSAYTGGGGSTYQNNVLFSSDNSLFFLANHNTATSGTGKIYFTTGGYDNNPTMTITEGNTGNVGIGTSSPSAKMQLKSSLFQSNTVDFSLLDNAGNERTSIASTGQQRWYLSTTTAEVGKIEYATPNAAPGIVLWTGTTYGTYTNRFNMVNLGSQFMLGYGTTSTDFNDFVIKSDGGILMPYLANTTGVSANMYYNTTTDELMYITSSQRYKTNIRDYDRGIDDLMKLRPVYYQPKNSTTNNNIYNTGFIAEEVESIGLTEYIDYDENGLANSIHYSLMTAILTKATQEQQAIIETQQTEITNLKTENQNLNTLIQTLITRIEALENK